MARPKKGEGKAVRIAFTGPTIDHDQMIDFSIEQNEADRKRASSAGESRAQIKSFLDLTSLNGKALAWGRQILKINDKDDGQAKAMDVIMSLEKVLPMLRAHVAGQGTAALPLDAPPEQPASAPILTQGEDPTFTDGPDDDEPVVDEDWHGNVVKAFGA
jgi:hypothetical protein